MEISKKKVVPGEVTAASPTGAMSDYLLNSNHAHPKMMQKHVSALSFKAEQTVLNISSTITEGLMHALSIFKVQMRTFKYQFI